MDNLNIKHVFYLIVCLYFVYLLRNNNASEKYEEPIGDTGTSSGNRRRERGRRRRRQNTDNMRGAGSTLAMLTSMPSLSSLLAFAITIAICIYSVLGVKCSHFQS